MATSQLPRLPAAQPRQFSGPERHDSYRRTGPKPAHARGTSRLRGLDAREKWGYGVWLFTGLVFGIPESWAGIATPPWPALSDTIAHLESIWAPTAVIVAALIVITAVSVTQHPPAHGPHAAAPSPPEPQPAGHQRPTGPSPAPALAYFPLALATVAGGGLIAAAAGGSIWVLGYTIYGLFTIFLVIIPNIIAFRFAQQVPFPPLTQTIANLQHRWRPATTIIITGLVILMIHLTFAPWPDIFRHHTGRQPAAPPAITPTLYTATSTTTTRDRSSHTARDLGLLSSRVIRTRIATVAVSWPPASSHVSIPSPGNFA